MKFSHTFRALVVVSCCVIGTSAARIGYAQHIHDSHPEALHGGPNGTDYVRIALEDWSGVNPSVTVTGNTWQVVANVSRANNSCNDAPVTMTQSYQRTQSVSVTISATASAGLKGAADMLFAELEGSVGVSGTTSAGYTWTSTETFNISDSMVLPPCEKVKFGEAINKKVASGTIDYWDHRITCQSTIDSHLANDWCNRAILSGTATGYMERRGGWTADGTVEGCDCSGGGGACGGG